MTRSPLGFPVWLVLVFSLCCVNSATKNVDTTTIPAEDRTTITREWLLSTEFALFEDTWAVYIPGGKPLRFNADGTISSDDPYYNGLSWHVDEDNGVLVIDGRLFQFDPDRECLLASWKNLPPHVETCIKPKGEPPTLGGGDT